MDKHSDLPLFRWEPPKVQVIPFPLAARKGKIRDVAEKFAGKTRPQQEAYWRQVREHQLRNLGRLGLSNDIVLREWRSFYDAVQGELNRRSYERVAVAGQSGGGDAA